MDSALTPPTICIVILFVTLIGGAIIEVLLDEVQE